VAENGDATKVGSVRARDIELVGKLSDADEMTIVVLVLPANIR
jgi:hypothetical protein